MQRGCGNPAGTEAVDLILHQADQWAQDDRRAFANQRWQLIADGLAATGGKNQEGVATVEDRRHGLALERSKPIMPPDFAQKRLRLIDWVGAARRLKVDRGHHSM